MSIKICSIAPEEFKIKRSYNWNGIVLPGCKKGEKFSFVVINDHQDLRVVAIDHWAEHSEKTPVNIPAQQIVTDFFSAENLSAKGAFVPTGDEPTAEEIATAHATRRSYLEKCVLDGDSEFSRAHRVDDIPGEWKRAASELNVDREWAFRAPAPTMECPVCGEVLKQGVAVCRSCGAVLDRQKAEQYGLLNEPVKRSPGRPKKEKAVSAA